MVGASAYADTVNNPGSIEFAAGGDSRISSGSGYNMYTQNASFIGSIDSSGETYFDLFDISFDQYTDPNGYTTQLQPLDDASGAYCPNSGDAEIRLTARIKVTKVNGTPITPCYITIDSGDPFLLTTLTSGSLTGADVHQGSPMFVAELSLSGTVTGGCSSGQKAAIVNYYGLPATGSFLLSGASIDPTNFSGDGC